LPTSANLRALDARSADWPWFPLVLLAAFALLRHAPTGFRRTSFPSKPMRRSPPMPASSLPNKFGGYLNLRSNGTLKVFFDGRSDLYGAEFLKQYAASSRSGRLVGILAVFPLTHALLPNDYSLVQR